MMEMNSGIINVVFDKKFQVQVGEDLKESFFCCRNSSKSPLTMSTFSSKSVLSMIVGHSNLKGRNSAKSKNSDDSDETPFRHN